MLNISVSFFNISSKFVQTFVPSVNKLLNARFSMQRMMLAAVQATDERLIALQYLMWISAHLAFSSSAQKDNSHWGPSPYCRASVKSFCPQ